MAPSEIYKALSEIRATFPKSSKMFVGFIDLAQNTGALEGSAQRGSVISMKSAWQLENKAPTARFAPTDESVIAYVRKAAGEAEQAACKLMVVIDLPSNAIDVWKVSKGMCFIATAACGDPFAPEVVFLSAFRDDVLVHGRIGRAFISVYNRVSPVLAAIISRSAWLRRAAVVVIVNPAVRVVRAYVEKSDV